MLYYKVRVPAVTGTLERREFEMREFFLITVRVIVVILTELAIYLIRSHKTH